MNIVETIRLHYPLPIARLYGAAESDSEPRLQVPKLLEWFESIVRHLSLIGLAAYHQYKLMDAGVDDIRKRLEKPSLGTWVDLLCALAPLLEQHDLQLLGTNPRSSRKSDEVAECVRILASVLGQNDKPTSVKLKQFFEWMVRFRNKKHGHGSLSERDAKQSAKPMMAALMRWLEELTIFQQQQMIYIKRVEYEDGQFVYRGINLNAGASQLGFLASGSKGIQKERLYLYDGQRSELLPLHPWFLFDEDSRVLYAYSELSKLTQILLRCPYDEPGAKAAIEIDCDKTFVLGSGVSGTLGATKPIQLVASPSIEHTSTNPTIAQDASSVGLVVHSSLSELGDSQAKVDSTSLVISTVQSVESSDPTPQPGISQPAREGEKSESDVTPAQNGHLLQANKDLPVNSVEITSPQAPFEGSPTLQQQIGLKRKLIPASSLKEQPVERVCAVTFDELVQQFQARIQDVCRPHARYPVIWLVGGPCTGKSQLARAVCAQTGWQYINFTLDPGCLDYLYGREETYRPEDALALVRSQTVNLKAPVVIIDELEPLLGWWPWDEQEIFFSQISKATRLPCGLVLVTRVRNAQQLAKHLPHPTHIFTIPAGVKL